MKASLHIKDGKVTRITYEEKKGKFKSDDLKNLKKFVKAYQYVLIEKWCDYFVKHITPKCETITKKL